ncbi:hypothetical protein DID80_01995 [Candidatus Marinamargulisbacteria bacterium SCGC AAA071-K20]|nr:hypothetical protein DID80_01995 [Candidatus Marinamargulisbacteria bacterium SCGC AAA071-K20]
MNIFWCNKRPATLQVAPSTPNTYSISQRRYNSIFTNLEWSALYIGVLSLVAAQKSQVIGLIINKFPKRGVL